MGCMNSVQRVETKCPICNGKVVVMQNQVYLQCEHCKMHLESTLIATNVKDTFTKRYLSIYKCKPKLNISGVFDSNITVSVVDPEEGTVIGIGSAASFGKAEEMACEDALKYFKSFC